MAKSHKPVVWFPFAAGGTVIAFCIPVIVVLTFLAALGHVPAGLSYERMHAFAGSGLGKLILFGRADEVKFRREVVPGETLRFEMRMTRSRGPVGKAEGKAFVGSELTCSALITFMITEA